KDAGMSRSKFRQEMRFFFQACTTTVLFAVMDTNFYVIAPVAATTKWWSFAFYTVNWELCHALDGIALWVFTLIMHMRTRTTTGVTKTTRMDESTVFQTRQPPSYASASNRCM
ncbi:CRE-SRX-12 protein, partial [Aphelenchoides avenae]